MVTLLFMFLSIVFVVIVALIWNSGRVISAKMRAQAAADQAAFAAAAWNSRALNVTTATNMLILRNASAQVSSLAIRHVYEGVLANWTEAERVARECPPDPDANPCLDAYLAARALEEPEFALFVSRCYVEAIRHLNEGTFVNRILELSEFQTGFIEGIPEVIEEQRGVIAAFHGVEIYLAVPGRIEDEWVAPPVRVGDRQSFERMLRERRLNDNARPGSVDLARIDAIGQARSLWAAGVEQAIVQVAEQFALNHHVLVTQVGADEFGPATASRQPFTVFATAVVPEVSVNSFLFLGFFDLPPSPSDDVMSCAQAETFSIEDESRAALNMPDPFPFRVWTIRGWTWQPRLTRCDSLREVIDAHEPTREAFARIGLPEAHAGRILLGLQH